MNKVCNCIHGAAQIEVNPQVRLALSLPPEIENVSLAEQLRRTKARLTPETWIREKYYEMARARPSAPKAARSAALAVEVAMAAAAVVVAAAWTKKREAEEAAGGEVPAEKENTEQDKLSIWANRPDYVRTDFFLTPERNYGKTNLHYLMGMFGLTAAFNDSPDTTLDMIHAKFDEAIAFAEEHAEFLANN